MLEQRLTQFCDEVRDKGVSTFGDEVEAMQVENQLRRMGIRTLLTKVKDGVWQVQMAVQPTSEDELFAPLDKPRDEEDPSLKPLLVKLESMQGLLGIISKKINEDFDSLVDNHAKAQALLLRWVELMTVTRSDFNVEGRTARLNLLKDTQAFLSKEGS